jgi:hypothetical protein
VSVTYQVQVVHEGEEEKAAQLGRAVAAEMARLGLHRSVSVGVSEDLAGGDAPALTILLAGPSVRTNAGVAAKLEAAHDLGVPVLPVVDDLAHFASVVPDSVSRFNGFEWSGADAAEKLARVILEQLDIEDRERRVFVSHRRSDGLAVAEQLHDALSHARFDPFIDRFAIRPGQDVQARIADALEAFAFLLVLETPDAHVSDWVFDEVDYALAHAMGMLIVSWPGEPDPVPGSLGIPRLQLDNEDFIWDGVQGLLTDDAVDRVVRATEAAHARGLVRRRRMLIGSVQEAAEAAGANCTVLKDWTLDVSTDVGRTIVTVAPRLPESEDLHRLDRTRVAVDATASAILVHAARRLDADRQSHLQWVRGDRDLGLCPENAVGGIW